MRGPTQPPPPRPPAAALRTRPSGVRDTCLRLRSPVGVVIAEPSASSSSSSPPLPPKLTRGLQRPVSQLCRPGPAAFEQLYRAVPEMGRRMCSPPPPPPPSKDSDACFRFRVRFRFPLALLALLALLICSASQLLCVSTALLFFFTFAQRLQHSRERPLTALAAPRRTAQPLPR